MRKDVQDRRGPVAAGWWPHIESRSAYMPATVSTIVFDCADPGAPAEFYRTATGWKVLADRAGHVFCLIPAEQS
jgi:hypothetical protein